MEGDDKQISFNVDGWRVFCRKPYTDVFGGWAAAASNDVEQLNSSGHDPETALRNLANRIGVLESTMLAAAGL